eukprot:446295-Prymnesium_polylepis.1
MQLSRCEGARTQRKGGSGSRKGGSQQRYAPSARSGLAAVRSGEMLHENAPNGQKMAQKAIA